MTYLFVYVLGEAQRIFKKDIGEELQKIPQQRIQRLQHKLLPKLLKAPMLLRDHIKGKGVDEVLCLLPLLFNNKLEYYVKYTEESASITTPYPCINITKEKTMVFLQRSELCTVASIREAILVMVLSYWIFDMQFPTALRSALEMLSLLLNISTDVSTPVQRLINLL